MKIVFGYLNPTRRLSLLINWRWWPLQNLIKWVVTLEILLLTSSKQCKTRICLTWHLDFNQLINQHHQWVEIKIIYRFNYLKAWWKHLKNLELNNCKKLVQQVHCNHKHSKMILKKRFLTILVFTFLPYKFDRFMFQGKWFKLLDISIYG